MSKAKRRVKTFPKRKDAPKTTKGFVGTRFYIENGLVKEASVAVVGEFAFRITRASRSPFARRSEIINPARLFASRAAAFEALKPKRGYVLTYEEKLVPARIVADDSGVTRAYIVKKDKEIQFIHHGKHFLSRGDALSALLKKKSDKRDELRKQLAAAQSEFERAELKLNQVIHSMRK
jgi:hypothetical protein